MAREAIEEIKKAEKKASEIIENAHIEAEKIINDAFNADEKLSKELDLQLENELNLAIAKAQQEADSIGKQNTSDAQKQASLAEEKFLKGKQKAIKKVIEAVLS